MTAKYEKLLGEIFDGARTGLRAELTDKDYETRRSDFIFHMTDWTSDLEELRALLVNPKGKTKAEASALVIGFLYHVIPHLTAAGQLLLDGEIPGMIGLTENDAESGDTDAPDRAQAKKKARGGA